MTGTVLNPLDLELLYPNKSVEWHCCYFTDRSGNRPGEIVITVLTASQLAVVKSC